MTPSSITEFSTLIFFGCFSLAVLFEFANGFHDTANAVATVIYTRTLKPTIAVIVSGLCNFLGVVLSNSAVAAGIVNLLPPEFLVDGAGHVRIIAIISLLLTAVSWNIGTWYLGIPASSSHTLIGAIIGAGLGYSLLPGHSFGDGVNWHKALEIGQSLLVSPFIGLIFAYILLKIAQKILKGSHFFDEPAVDAPPPFGIRLCLIFTSVGVSFTHGWNDGQKGIGLLLLILLTFFPSELASMVSFHEGKMTIFHVPSWLVLITAISLGCGTLVGWRRIVITVGEKIGKSHLSYVHGASAELTTMATIGVSAYSGLPVSTTHVLSSAVAGTMMASNHGVQRNTVFKILSAWFLTLPVTVTLSMLGTYIGLRLLL